MNIPLSEMLKSIPGAVGIRLEEELPFTLIKKEGDFELRHYDEFTLAETTVRGTYDQATDTAFKRLASFIFGKNSESLTTSMTTPVFLDKTTDGWTMSFYIPKESAWIRPNDPTVKVETHPAKEVAIYRYSGTQSVEAMEEAKGKLLDYVKTAGLKTTSEVWWAQFDQPMSLPMTKRNEALVKIALAS
ncbi:MAG: heme-binding protein [Bdellovibrionota bacterium]